MINRLIKRVERRTNEVGKPGGGKPGGDFGGVAVLAGGRRAGAVHLNEDVWSS